jgi:4'-phosphopantetheinyl transferase
VPIFKEITTKNGSKIAVWQIAESLLDLEQFTQLQDTKDYQNIVHEQRSLQWLAARAALKTVLPSHHRIDKDHHGKPHALTEIQKEHISLSHCNSFAAAMTGPSHVGIDIEEVTPRIERIANRFLHTSEHDLISSNNRLEDLFLIWSAKEAVYKSYGKRAVDFAQHMRVISSLRNAENQFDVEFSKHEVVTYLVHYELFDGHVLVWVEGGL